MKTRAFVVRPLALLIAGAIAALPLSLRAQVAPTPHPDHEALLRSNDSTLARNKRLVYDFWREVLEARHMDLAAKYLREDYIQHNPNVATGRQGFVDFFTRLGGPQPIAPKVKAPLISIVAEGDLVVLSFTREYPDPKDATRKYTTTWFDMFRVRDGKIAEHWDSALKQ